MIPADEYRKAVDNYNESQRKWVEDMTLGLIVSFRLSIWVIEIEIPHWTVNNLVQCRIYVDPWFFPVRCRFFAWYVSSTPGGPSWRSLAPPCFQVLCLVSTRQCIGPLVALCFSALLSAPTCWNLRMSIYDDDFDVDYDIDFEMPRICKMSIRHLAYPNTMSIFWHYRTSLVMPPEKFPP